jgi:hypothetical protein
VVVTLGAEKVLLTPDVIGFVQSFRFDNAYVLTTLTAVLSNLISNVPAVLALKPFMLGLADQHRIWLVIAMSATLAGNLWLGREPDRRRTRPRRRHSCLAVDLLPRWNSDYARHPCAGCLVVELSFLSMIVTH